MTGVPIAHISGGDVTLGAADDYYRHCITKMAHLHFPSCAEYARRVIRMGEAPDTVFNVGGLGDENIRTMPKMSREELSESLGFDLSGPFALVTFHPETAGGASPTQQVAQLLGAMEQLQKTQPVRWLITKANADAGGLAINELIDRWVEKYPDRAIAFTSLGVKRYLSAMACAAAVVGNSSSGVVETPTFGVPTVNIGERQAGRIICPNVICCPAEKTKILTALKTAFSPEFAAKAKQTVSPYNGVWRTQGVLRWARGVSITPWPRIWSARRYSNRARGCLPSATSMAAKPCWNGFCKSWTTAPAPTRWCWRGTF